MAEKQKKDSVSKEVKIRPLGTDLLVKQVEVKNKYEKKGWKTPDNLSPKTPMSELYDEDPRQAIVKKLGQDYDGEIKVGDIVYHIQGDGYEVIREGEVFHILKSDRIVAVKEQ